MYSKKTKGKPVVQSSRQFLATIWHASEFLFKLEALFSSEILYTPSDMKQIKSNATLSEVEMEIGAWCV
jgi:hypothetical protein